MTRSPDSYHYDPASINGYDGVNVAIWPLIPEGITSALDVGCGRGGNANWLTKFGAKVDGISWNAEELAIAKLVCRRIIRCDLNDGIPELQPRSYDCVICSHVLEHIAYPQKMLKDIHQAMIAGGYIIIAIPNIFFWSDRIKLLMGNWDYTESGTFDYTHLRWYTKKSMLELLTQYGFLPDAFLADGWVPLPGLKYLIRSNLRSEINIKACKWFPSLFGQQLIFRFRKP